MVQENIQVLVGLHSLNVHSLDVHRWGGRTVFAEIHHHLLGLPHVDEEVVLLTPVHKVLRQSSVLRVVIIADQADYGGVTLINKHSQASSSSYRFQKDYDAALSVFLPVLS